MRMRKISGKLNAATTAKTHIINTNQVTGYSLVSGSVEIRMSNGDTYTVSKATAKNNLPIE